MPSRDSTGARRSGTWQREQAARKAAAERRARLDAAGAPALSGGAPLPGVPRLHGATPPPRTSVGAAIAWCSSIQGAAAAQAATDESPELVRAITAITKAVAKIKGAAGDSENWVRAVMHYHCREIEVHDREPPMDEPAAIAVWAFWRLIDLMWVTICLDDVDEGQTSHHVRALVAVGSVFPSDAMDELIASIEGDAQAPPKEKTVH